VAGCKRSLYGRRRALCFTEQTRSHDPRCKALELYRAYGKHTDPGEFGYLYQGLPASLAGLCDLVKAQLIHPAERDRYADALPAGREREDADSYSVSEMLRGLTMDRGPAERLVLSCRFHAMLLASMVKSQGTPARVRVDFAGYLRPETGKHHDHWVTEAWHQQEQRWVTVDADVKRVDVRDFEIAGDVWLSAKRGEVDPQVYGIHVWWGLGYVVGNLCHDL
jgi:transglutaminase-like putative cysteine protease